MDSKFIYTPYYCEENIYKLIERKQQESSQEPGVIKQYFAVFITNPFKQTHVRFQKVGNPKEQYSVYWDYHVIMVEKITISSKIEAQEGQAPKMKISTASTVYDFDSTLGLQTDFETYFEKALKNPKLPTLFRVVAASKLLEEFASDRSHMLSENKKTYRKPVPEYPCIKGAKATSNMNLMDYLDVGNEQLGQWYQEKQFEQFFQKKST